MKPFAELAPEVYGANAPLVDLSAQDLEWLKGQCLNNPKGRARICAHQTAADSVHEMIIVLAKGFYVRPHLHVGKSESLHAMEGEADLVLFRPNGEVDTIHRLGALRDGNICYFRVSEPRYHTLVVRSDFFVFHETTSGPFLKSETTGAPWAPPEEDVRASQLYLETLTARLDGN